MPRWLRGNISGLLSLLAAMGGLAVAVSSLGSLLPVRTGSVEVRVQQLGALSQLSDEVAKLRADLKGVKDSVQVVSRLPEETKLAIHLQGLQKTVADIQSRQGKLEQVILASPSKALEIPLLQRDLENLKAAQQASILAIKEGVDRVYDLNKWLLGAMAISIVTLAIGNFLKEREPAGEKK